MNEKRTAADAKPGEWFRTSTGVLMRFDAHDGLGPCGRLHRVSPAGRSDAGIYAHDDGSIPGVPYLGIIDWSQPVPPPGEETKPAAIDYMDPAINPHGVAPWIVKAYLERTPLRTRRGDEVEVISIKWTHGYPVLSAIKNATDQCDASVSQDIHGRITSAPCDKSCDLLPPEEPFEFEVGDYGRVRYDDGTDPAVIIGRSRGISGGPEYRVMLPWRGRDAEKRHGESYMRDRFTRLGHVNFGDGK